MTTAEIQKYYADLLILEYIGKPRAYEMIYEFVAPFIMDQLPTTVQNAFCVGTSTIAGTVYPGAIGNQLDVLAKYSGVTRSGYGLTGNPITLSDLDFTRLIQMAIIRNNSGSSLATIQNLIHMYFANEIFVYDSANMQMSYLITSAAGTIDLVELFVTEGLLPKPMGVLLSSIIYIEDISLFGFESYSDPIEDWNPSTNYTFGSRVIVNGIVYQSLVANNLNNVVTDMDFWIAIIYPFNSYATYPTYQPYTWLSYADTLIIV